MQPKTIAHKWLNDRGITDEVIALFNIDTAYDHPTIGECIKIPIVDGPNGWSKYRRHPLSDQKPKYLYDKGGKVTLYGYNKLEDRRTKLLVTEGELDTLVAWSQNIPAVSSTGGAMSFQENWKEIGTSHDVYVCFDNDDAGAEGMVKVLQYLPDAKVVFVPTMPGVKDISDYVAKGGDLHELLSTARNYADVGEVEEDMKKRKASWQSITFHEKYLAKHREKEHRTNSQHSYRGDDRVLKAKAYPMGNLIKFDRYKARCPWHNEKTPSLQYYPKNNNAYCFGCGRAFDSIDAYMHVHGVGFLEAVKKLSGVMDPLERSDNKYE